MTLASRISAATNRLSLLLLLNIAACGGGGGDSSTNPPPPPPSTPVVTSLQVTGSGQTARIGQALEVSPTVTVKDQSGKPMAGVTVNFALSAGGGALGGTSALSDAAGIATVPTWVLGPTPGENRVTASASGGKNPSVQITATARPPRWTVLVYMAADNTLAISGVGDLEEMEAAGANPEVQVVVQGEFSPTVFAQVGATPATVHLPNYNTFRYAFGGLTPLGAPVPGPNGSTTDIGNRNMTDPAELRAFLQWGKATYPAEHYALMLWNHGGGYAGLLSDETSSNGRPMDLPGLKSALTGVGTIDLIDFDMCLMGGYETLAAINGVAKTAVFSQEVEPGEGNPYTGVLQALYQTPTMDDRSLASTIVDRYNAFYVASGRSSVTKSAYDLAGYPAFDAAVTALAQSLSANAQSLAVTVAGGSRVSQKFEYRMFTDVSDLMDSLSVRISSADVQSRLAAVKAQVNASSFRISNRTYTSSGSQSSSVSRANGLSIVLPSGASSSDWFQPAGGPMSLAAYQAAMPNNAWAQFLSAYVTALASPSGSYVDLGTNRWEVYLVWDTASVSHQADVDLWVLEPNGNLYIPYLGSVTPNGAMSSDSQQDQTFYEGYMMNRYVQTGRYKFYANLWADPQNHRPVYDLWSRQSPAVSLSSLFAPNYPTLSLQTSWLNDPTPTFAEVEAGSYTDLQYAAYLDISAATPDRLPMSSSGARASVSPAASPVSLSSDGRTGIWKAARDVAPSGQTIRDAQLRTLRTHWPERTARRRAAQLSPRRASGISANVASSLVPPPRR